MGEVRKRRVHSAEFKAKVGMEASNLGVAAVIPVGMGRVSSVVMTASPGRNLRKGEEFGYFQFGASDIIVLFREGAGPDIDSSDSFHHYDSPIVHCQLLE